MGTGISGLFSGTKGSKISDVKESGNDPTKSPGKYSILIPNVKYPGNDPTKSPGRGFEWRGRGDPASGRGSWFNPKTNESWFPNLNHLPPIGPHWDYRDANNNGFRVYEDGRIKPKWKGSKK